MGTLKDEQMEMLPIHTTSGDSKPPARSSLLARRCSLRVKIMTLLALSTLVVVFYLGARSAFSAHTRPATPFPSFPSATPTLPPPLPTDPIWAQRAQSVKQAFLHAYNGYTTYATFPNDELMPVSNKGQHNFNGWGVTAVDSLDTMWLMGLDAEFSGAVAQVGGLNFSMTPADHAPFFETVIRYLGGLLSAHALSGNPVLLARADDLGRMLLPIFNSPSGLPYFSVNTQTGATADSSDRPGRVFLAEIASCQMEFKYLAHLTGKKEYFQKTEKVMDMMRSSQLPNGMWNTIWDVRTGAQVNDHVGVAAGADSAYEYVLKQYLLSRKFETDLMDMFTKATSGVIRNLLYLSPTRNLLYLSDLENGQLTGKFEHLACFFPGLLALGASTLNLADSERQLYLWAAEGLGHSCWIMYADQASGLGPELAIMDRWPGDWKEGRWIDQVEQWQRSGGAGGKPPGVKDLAPPVHGGRKDYYLSVGTYLSRPETLESMFILWRTTKDPIWREHGWAIWDAIEKKTRTPSGYASVQNVDQSNPYQLDSMPSYFLAETIKYAYLLALDEDPWPADKYMFNTEAHPLPIFDWQDWEKQAFGIHHAG